MQCPYAGGDAVYYARAMLAQISAPQFYDDVQLCPIDSADTTSSGSLKMLVVNNPPPTDTAQSITAKISGFEFAQVYPNPAKQIINLAYYVNTTGSVEFDLMDALGEKVMQAQLGGTQNFAQFGTGSLSNGLYYWVLKTGERTIKTGKVSIMK